MESPPGIRLVNISEYIKKGTEVPFFIQTLCFILYALCFKITLQIMAY